MIRNNDDDDHNGNYVVDDDGDGDVLCDLLSHKNLNGSRLLMLILYSPFFDFELSNWGL